MLCRNLKGQSIINDKRANDTYTIRDYYIDMIKGIDAEFSKLFLDI